MSWGGPKIFCDLTDPHWVCLGTHRHPWKLPSRYLERANFFVFWAISRISKVNNTYYMSWGGQKIFCDLTDPHRACLGTHSHPWELPSGYLERANFFVFWAISKISKANNIYMYCGGRNVVWDLTDPHWACLGTHRHPWELPSA